MIVVDESPERAVHDNNYHYRDRPCKEGVPSPDADGKVVVARKLRRKEVLAFFARLAPCLVNSTVYLIVPDGLPMFCPIRHNT